MSNVLIGIINRNSPETGDTAYEHFSQTEKDIVLLENGSDPENVSKYMTHHAPASNGISWGVNYICKVALEKGYDYVWLCWNDARFEKPIEFLNWSIEKMESDKSIGIVTGYWSSVWDLNGRKNTGVEDVSFFDPLSFIVSSDCLKVTSNHDFRLDPFWDSSNHVGHYNILGPSFALYQAGMRIVTNKNFIVTEDDPVRAISDEKKRNEMSKKLRGYDENYWHHDLGVRVSEEWMDGFFPIPKDRIPEGVKLSPKQKRDFVIRTICDTYIKRPSRGT
ncbi:hypothetical protein CL614_09005 [archaeon]|nr:hypothetical protein [archaeon]|tara:strand:+ start:824 stop:1654 length:831 start_codon:yes stop_codon:yes gene_type:complete